MKVSYGAYVLLVADLFKLGCFRPAAVQRDYQWQEQQCQQLLDDLEGVFSLLTPADADGRAATRATAPAAAEDRAIAIGLDAVVEGDNPHTYHLNAMVALVDGEAGLEVFDGLQRLTTLTILICVLRDLVGDKALAAELNALVFDAGRRPRLKLASDPAPLRAETQPIGEAGKVRHKAADPGSEAHRLTEAARLFRNALKNWPPEKTAGFARFVMGNVFINLMIALDARQARQIFVSTNMRGMPIDRVDLFKGQLMDLADGTTAQQDVLRRWTSVATQLGDQLEPFLLAVDFMHRRKVQGADCLTELAEYLRLRHRTNLSAWLDRFERWAMAWRELEGRMRGPVTDLDREMFRLRLIDWDQWRPLALVWYADYVQKRGGNAKDRVEQTLAERFTALHRRCLAISLAGYTAADRARIFGNAVSQAIDGYSALNGALALGAAADAKIRTRLECPLPEPRRALLDGAGFLTNGPVSRSGIGEFTRSLVRWLEAERAGSSLDAEAVMNATTEHVLPRRPAEGSQWLIDFPDNDQRHTFMLLLGNLAVVDIDHNMKLENHDFARKRLIASPSKQTFLTWKEVAEHKEWTPTVIRERTAKLAREVFAALQLPARTPEPVDASGRA